MKRIKGMAIMMVLLLVAGCSSGTSTEEDTKAVTFDEMVTAIKEQIAIDLKDSGVKEDVLIDGKLIYYIETNLTASEDSDPAIAIWTEKMGLNKDEIINGTVLAAMMNVNADEIILLEAKDEKHIASLKETLEKELEGQVQTWKQYLPAQ